MPWERVYPAAPPGKKAVHRLRRRRCRGSDQRTAWRAGDGAWAAPTLARREKHLRHTPCRPGLPGTAFSPDTPGFLDGGRPRTGQSEHIVFGIPASTPFVHRMTRDGLRHLLAWAVVAALLLPVLLVVLLGLSALLAAVGDGSGARACGRGAIVGGVAWVGAVVVTVAVNAMLTLAGPGGERTRGRRRRRLRMARRMSDQAGEAGLSGPRVDGRSTTG